jgi:hypothetical protein
MRSVAEGLVEERRPPEVSRPWHWRSEEVPRGSTAFDHPHDIRTFDPNSIVGLAGQDACI